MADVKLTIGKYSGRFVSDLCKDRRYMNWIMTTWDHTATIPRAIIAYIEAQKAIIKSKYASRKDPEFIREWLQVSYDGYKILDADLGWVNTLLGTSTDSITLGFIRSEYVFKIAEVEFAIRPLVINERSDVFGAFRNDIQEQIQHFRQKCFHNKTIHKCPETGILLKNIKTTHTDHHFRQKTFVDLVTEFIEVKGLDFNTVQIENCGMFYRLKDRSISEAWRSYHEEHAILRLIHESANTNPEYYIKKFKEPPFEEKPKKTKVKAVEPTIRTFDELLNPT